MQPFVTLVEQGFTFVRRNPQIIFTITLLVLIPVAFFYTSEQFLSIARENQDRLERSRVGLLQDVFAEFLKERTFDQAYTNAKLRKVAEDNETIRSFQVLAKEEVGRYRVLASLSDLDLGEVVTPDEATVVLLSAASGDPSHSYSSELYDEGERYWRTVRAIPEGGHAGAYLVADVSMTQADTITRASIRKAYIVLVLVVLAIMVLLARQARIIDYAALYARLKEVDQMKDDFVSMAAHELRSPLTVIRGYVNLLGDEPVLSVQGKENLQHIDESAVRLNLLVGDILDVAKLQEGRMSFNYASLDPNDIIASVVESFGKPASDKGLALRYLPASLPKISVDPDRFRQVLINLIGNAVKYTPKGEVRVITKVERGKLEIRVSDTGMGISSQDQKHLFEKFFRVKSEETAEITGTGLGLWIVGEIVKTMKGSISVESIKNKGTDFILTFPVLV